jgi:hypothetical protein
MPSLKATQAREIDKATITEAETLAFEGRIISQTGKQTMEPGEFYFRTTGIPITKYPNWFERLFWTKPQTTWKTVSTIVIACPYCATPLMTTSALHISQLSPLTINGIIACPYSQNDPHSLMVKEGNIIAA